MKYYFAGSPVNSDVTTGILVEEQVKRILPTYFEISTRKNIEQY